MVNADRDKSEQPARDFPCCDTTPAAEQLFGHERADGNTEHRIVCDKCGQIMGLFHKGCDGRWVREFRTVTDWTRTRAPERPAGAGTPTGAPAPSQAATGAHSDENQRLRVDVQYLNDRLADRRDENEALRAEVERLRAEVDALPYCSRDYYWRAIRRAERVEAKVARVEALCDDWDRVVTAESIRAALAGPATEEGQHDGI